MEPDYRIETAKPEHIGMLLDNVREPDRVEFEACGFTPAMALHEAMSVSHQSWAALRDGEVLCIFGTSDKSILTGVGIPWMIGSRLLDRHAAWFLKRCKPAIKILLENYAVLENVIDARNTRAIRWLQWLGFTIHPAEPHGLNGELFHHFEMRGSNV